MSMPQTPPCRFPALFGHAAGRSLATGRRTFVVSLAAAVALCPGVARATDDLVLGLESTASGQIRPVGEPLAVGVTATFDQVIAAVSFVVTASGPAQADITERTLAAELSHIGYSGADPYDGDLPFDLTGPGLMREVLTALLTAHRPGSADDGLTPATEFDLARYTLVPSTPGPLALNLSDPSAVTTQLDEGGTVFDSSTVDPAHASVNFTITPRADMQLDLDVDLADFAAFQCCLGQAPTGDCAQADQDQNGQINLSDFNAVAGCLAGPGQTPACP